MDFEPEICNVIHSLPFKRGIWMEFYNLVSQKHRWICTISLYIDNVRTVRLVVIVCPEACSPSGDFHSRPSWIIYLQTLALYKCKVELTTAQHLIRHSAHSQFFLNTLLQITYHKSTKHSKLSQPKNWKNQKSNI